MKPTWKKVSLVFLGSLLVIMISAAQILPGSDYEQSTYTPNATYTPLPTYTPHGINQPTATNTPLPTSTPYGDNSSSPINEPMPTLEDDLRSYYKKHPILAENYEFGEFFRSERIVNNQRGFCFSINEINPSRRFGEICLFLDEFSNLPGPIRLQEFGMNDNETNFKNAPILGEFSLMYTGMEEGEQYYRGSAIQGAWVIGYHFGSFEGVDIPIEIGRIFESFFTQMDPAIVEYQPDSLTSSSDVYMSNRIIGILSSVDLSELSDKYVIVGLNTFNRGGYTAHELIFIYESTTKQAGAITIYPYSNWNIDVHQTMFQANEFKPFSKPIITTKETIGDRSVMFKSDENPAGQMIVQRFQKFDLFVDVSLMNKGNNSVKDAREIAERVVKLITPPDTDSFRPNGNVLEQQLMNCFPSQGDIGLDRPMYQFTWSTDMKDHGFEYSTRYTDFRVYDHWGPVGVLFINMTAFVTPMTGQDIPIYHENEYNILLDYQQYSDIGDRSEGWLLKNTYNRPQTYDSGLYFQKGSILVEIGFGEMVDSEIPYHEDILAVMSDIARSIDQCLPEDPVLPTEISVPTTVNEQLPDETLIEIIEIKGNDNQENPMVDGYTVIPLPTSIHFMIHEQLKAPLTIAIYNPEHNVYTYRKQEKVVPPIGDYFSIIRTEGYSTFIEGINELRVWSGDQLILIYRFVLSRTWGDRS